MEMTAQRTLSPVYPCVPTNKRAAASHNHNVACLTEILARSEEIAAKLVSEYPQLLRERSSSGETALYWFAIENNVDAVRFLIARGCDVNAPSNAGDAPLTNAARLGHAAMCELLLDAGADVHAGEGTGDTALHAASRAGAIAVIELLRARGAKANVTNEFDQTPADVALPRKREAIIAALN